MPTIATTVCTICGPLYYGDNRQLAIKANIRHGKNPRNAEHTIITEIRKNHPNKPCNPITIISGNN